MIQQGTCYIVGAGTFYDRDFAPGAGDFVIAADGGYGTLTARGTDMDLVVGDFDSMGFRPDHPKVVDLPVEKDDTDTMAGPSGSTAAPAAGWTTPWPTSSPWCGSPSGAGGAS